MGCDIHMHMEQKVDGEWREIHGEFSAVCAEDCPSVPFDWRTYAVFSFLNHEVRNYGGMPPVFGEEGRGVPDDSVFKAEWEDEYSRDYHSASWLLVSELLAVDYDNIMTQYANDPLPVSLRDTLHDFFFMDLKILKDMAGEYPENIRLVFWFDN